MNLSVVIVNWNSGDCLRALLDSLVPLAREVEDVLVVDNDSRDQSLEAVERFPQVRVLRNPDNAGFAAAANQGIGAVPSPLVLLLNPDVILRADSVRELCREITRRPRTAIVTGALKNSEGRSQSEFQIRPFPRWDRILCDVLFLDEVRCAFRKQAGEREIGLADPSGGRELRWEQPAAAFWLLRKQAWLEIGGFDTRFHPAWFEDVDFCRRLRQADWQIFYFPGLEAVHQGGISMQHLSYAAFLQIFYRNLLKYLRKHHPVWHPLLWAPIQLGLWTRRVLVRR